MSHQTQSQIAQPPLNVEFKHVKYFVTGMVAAYWTTVLQKPTAGADYDRYVEESIAKAWGYIQGELRADSSFTDVQCQIAHEVHRVLAPNAVPL